MKKILLFALICISVNVSAHNRKIGVDLGLGLRHFNVTDFTVEKPGMILGMHIPVSEKFLLGGDIGIYYPPSKFDAGQNGMKGSHYKYDVSAFTFAPHLGYNFYKNIFITSGIDFGSITTYDVRKVRGKKKSYRLNNEPYVDCYIGLMIKDEGNVYLKLASYVIKNPGISLGFGFRF